MILPWGAMMQAAVAAGLSPQAFWRLSLREWGWLAAGGAAMGREDFRKLMDTYPDTDENKDDKDHDKRE